MNPVPSPYSAATGGVKYAGRPLHEEPSGAVHGQHCATRRGGVCTCLMALAASPPAPPLLPLWRVTWTHASGSSILWLRASSVLDAIAETRRLHPSMCTATVVPWLDPEPHRTAISEAREASEGEP